MAILWDHDRIFYAPEEKPEGLYRVLCLGDSMIYGAGVNPDQTLPAHLEHFLNRAIWNNQIEVLNGGVSGYSLYDGWHRFVLKGQRYNPDLVAFIICDNDAELFSVTAARQADPGLTYEDHVRGTWEKDSIHYPHLVTVFEQIKSQMQSSGIPFLIAFYCIYDPEFRDKIVSSLTEICNSHKIDFVDLSADFTDADSSCQRDSLMVNRLVDGHPSDYAHRIAGQRLAQFIIRNKYLGSKKQSEMDEHALFENLSDLAVEMQQCGYSDQILFSNLKQLYESKHESKARLKLPDKKLLKDEEYRLHQEGIESLITARNHLLYWQAYDHLLNRNAESIAAIKIGLEGMITRISKALFVLDNFLSGISSININFFDPLSGTFDGQSFNEIPSYLADWSDNLNQVTAWLSEFNTITDIPVESTLSYFVQNINAGSIATESRLLSRINDLETLLSAVTNLYDTYMATFNNYKSMLNADLKDSFVRLGDVFVHSVDYLKNMMDLYQFESLSEPSRDNVFKSITHCRIRMSSSAKDTFSLWVQAVNEFPGGIPISDSRWVINDGEMHNYDFEFPLLLFGKVNLELNPKSDAEIEEVQLYNNSKKKISFPMPDKKPGSKGHYSLPSTLISI